MSNKFIKEIERVYGNMLNEIKSAIVYKLKELYPTYNQYIDDVPQNYNPPAFVIYVINQNYSKRLNTKYYGRINFDVAYFSNKETSEIKSDCFTMQEILLRELECFGSFKALNKNAKITDNVLHLTFDVSYSEMKSENITKMQSLETNTNI